MSKVVSFVGKITLFKRKVMSTVLVPQDTQCYGLTSLCQLEVSL